MRRCLLSLACVLAAPLGAGETVHLGAYYYPWYGADGRHWREGYRGKAEGNPPRLGEYDSRSPGVVREHLALSKQYGIDHWICSWWGPGSWEDETLKRHVLPELERDRSESPEDAVEFCLLYEAGGLLGLDPGEGIIFDTARTNLFVSHFRYLADTYFDHPAYRRVEGRPVVYLYLSRTFGGDYVRALAGARAAAEARGYTLHLVGDEVYWHEPDPDRLRLLDAVTPYNLHGPPEYSGATDWTGFLADCERLQRRWREAALAAGVGYIPGLMPGFDSNGAAPGVHYILPRAIRPGAGPDSFLEAMAASAERLLDPALREAALTSFNEWHEGTQIEPSRSGENGGNRLGELLSE